MIQAASETGNGDQKKGERAEALDAFRGLAVLGMGLSGMVAFKTMPRWMYHAQEPPPTHEFNPLVLGITWVDLVFPFFLFALGASVPLALARRGGKDAVRSLLLRGAGLWVFALLGQHLRPFTMMGSPTPIVFFKAFLGWAGIVLLFWRGSGRRQEIFKGIGLALCLLIILTFLYPDGKMGFRWDRSDIILVVLANVAVSTGLIWLVTRNRPLVRGGIMAAVACFFLAATLPVDPASAPPIAKALWNWHPLPIGYVFQPEYHKYLLITLPGTFAGEMLARYLAAPEEDRELGPGKWIVALLGCTAPVVAVIGLLAREVGLTFGVVGAMAVAMTYLSRALQNRLGRLLHELSALGGGLLVAGFLAEPIGVGIRKDPPTLAYCLITAGLASLFLAALQVAFAGGRAGRRLALLTGTGANPMLAYVTIASAVPAVAGLLRLDELAGTLAERYFGLNPWVVSAWGLVKTLAVGGLAWAATRKGFFLRV